MRQVEPPTGPDDPNLGEKYTGMLDGLKAAVRRAGETMTGTSPEQIEMSNAFMTMLKDLRYPVGKDGSIMNADFFAPFVAYHLVRCGWRPNSEKRKIKPRRVPGKGTVEDAVEWVDMSEPDDPLRHLNTMSMTEVALLPEVWKHEAIRRLGGHVKSDLAEPKSIWHVDTKINIANMERDPNELFK
jgi:hypothetical protein